MAGRRFETAFSEEVHHLVKEMSNLYGISAKGYVAMAVTERVLADRERFVRAAGQEQACRKETQPPSETKGFRGEA